MGEVRHELIGHVGSSNVENISVRDPAFVVWNQSGAMAPAIGVLSVKERQLVDSVW